MCAPGGDHRSGGRSGDVSRASVRWNPRLRALHIGLQQWTSTEPSPSNSAVTTPDRMRHRRRSARRRARSSPRRAARPGLLRLLISQARRRQDAPSRRRRPPSRGRGRERNTQPSTWRSSSSLGFRRLRCRERPGPRRRCRRRSRAAGTARRYRESMISIAPNTASIARQHPVEGGRRLDPLAERNAISGSARGLMSCRLGTGSPNGSGHAGGQAAVHRLVDAEGRRLTLLVMPSLAPITLSPACSRCSTNSDCALYAVSTSRKG